MQTYCVGWPAFPGCGEFTEVNAYLYLCPRCIQRWYEEHARKSDDYRLAA